MTELDEEQLKQTFDEDATPIYKTQGSLFSILSDVILERFPIGVVRSLL